MSQPLTIQRTTSLHVRSTSLPCISNPLDSNVDVLLRTLSVAEPSNSATSICNNLYDIAYLYNNITCSIQCLLNQKVLSSEQFRNRVEDFLEGSLGLLDSCSSTKDVFTFMKESILELQSCLRRKTGVDEKDFDAYVVSRKKVQAMVNKCLKCMNKRNSNDGDNNNNIPILKILQQAETISLNTMKSMLIYSLKSKRNGKGWSLMAKIMHSNEIVEANEIQKIDQAISEFKAKNSSMNLKMTQQTLKQLETLEIVIQEIEVCLESISRGLLNTRVSLLNVLSSH